MARRIPKYLLDELLEQAKQTCAKVAEEPVSKLLEEAEQILKKARAQVDIHPEYEPWLRKCTLSQINGIIGEFGQTYKYNSRDNITGIRANVTSTQEQEEKYKKAIEKAAGPRLKEIGEEIKAKLDSLEEQYMAYRLDLIMGTEANELPEFNPKV